MGAPDQLLVRLAAHLRGESALEPDEAAALADAVEGVLAGHQDGVDQALGLTGAWRVEAARRRRDQLYQAAVMQHFPGMSVTARSHALAAAIRRFRADVWPKYSDHESCPARFNGTLQEYLWQAFAECGDVADLSARQLYEILKP